MLNIQIHRNLKKVKKPRVWWLVEEMGEKTTFKQQQKNNNKIKISQKKVK